ncbi:MAG: hypothetical protein RLY14_336 [Planctomycetota bacterium]
MITIDYRSVMTIPGPQMALRPSWRRTKSPANSIIAVRNGNPLSVVSHALERICSRRAAESSGCQHGNGLEELEPTDRNDATPATCRRVRLATIVPLDASQSANGTATRVPTARGLLLAWQFTTDRSAELPAGHRR